MKKILIVDDNPDIVDVITMVLDLEGYQIESIYNGTELFEKINHFNPDLVLLDVMLGDSDGRELCHQIKSDQKTAHIIVIMISASHDLGKMDEKLCKPDDMIAKPFDIQFLIDVVASHLENHVI